MTRDEILTRVRDILAETFEIDRERIKPEATLFSDLDLDSIDAIDLVVKLQDWTGRRVPEETLRAVRTVDDVVTMIEAHLRQAPGER
ncbi:MAG TPA: acyl carrier protein [Polyangia bacterium]|nr:acyl carrier protein [Polyangia bacterium]